MRMRSALLGVAGLAIAGLIGPGVSPAIAADLAGEVKAAITHATFASKSTSLKMAHTHLHHTINCLVGPDGKGFDAEALNPCKDLGNGILPDTQDAQQKKAFEAALAKAEAGLASDKLDTATKDASEVASMLEKTQG